MTAIPSASTRSRPTIPTPIGYWKFDEGTSTTASDSSGIATVGTLTNMDNSDWISGISGSALHFDGVGAYVELGPAPLLNFPAGDSFAISFWVNPDASSAQGEIFTKRPADGGSGGGPFYDVIVVGAERSLFFQVADTSHAPLTPAVNLQSAPGLTSWSSEITLRDGWKCTSTDRWLLRPRTQRMVRSTLGPIRCESDVGTTAAVRTTSRETLTKFDSSVPHCRRARSRASSSLEVEAWGSLWGLGPLSTRFLGR
jgi:hypothetical protein